MKSWPMSLLLFSSVVFIVVPGALANTAADFKLAKGARGAVCLTCHEAFKKKLKKKYVHTPLQEGDCTGCHSPHTANHGKLLAADPDRICYSCHDNVVPDGAKSVHRVVAEGKCVQCHDPHASDNKMNLVRPGSKLCFECHKNLAKKITSNKFPHAPVEEDCLTCHNPHASKDSPKLLRASSPDLCVECHDPGRKLFKKQHADYPVQKGDCTSCHNPHGSNRKAMLYDEVHEPVAKRMCKQCHAPAGSPTPFATLKPGYELCQGCHYAMVNETFNKGHMHWPVVDKKGCLNCHSPHASGSAPLLKGSLLQVCGQCHADTIARQERSQTKHPPIAQGKCSDCHEVHSSNNEFLLDKASSIQVCGQCHEWQTHSTHPIGAKVKDPRNSNLTLDCLSCHRTHGTRYKKFLYFGTVNDLCTQCHTKFRR